MQKNIGLESLDHYGKTMIRFQKTLQSPSEVMEKSLLRMQRCTCFLSAKKMRQIPRAMNWDYLPLIRSHAVWQSVMTCDFRICSGFMRRKVCRQYLFPRPGPNAVSVTGNSSSRPVLRKIRCIFLE